MANINSRYNDLNKIRDDLKIDPSNKDPITVTVRRFTGGRRYSVGGVDFSLKELIKHVSTLSKSHKFKPGDEKTFQEIVDGLAKLDKKGDAALKNANPIARFLTKIRQLFGNINFNKDKSLESITKKFWITILSQEKAKQTANTIQVPHSVQTLLPNPNLNAEPTHGKENPPYKPLKDPTLPPHDDFNVLRKEQIGMLSRFELVQSLQNKITNFEENHHLEFKVNDALIKGGDFFRALLDPNTDPLEKKALKKAFHLGFHPDKNKSSTEELYKLAKEILESIRDLEISDPSKKGGLLEEKVELLPLIPLSEASKKVQITQIDAFADMVMKHAPLQEWIEKHATIEEIKSSIVEIRKIVPWMSQEEFQRQFQSVGEEVLKPDQTIQELTDLFVVKFTEIDKKATEPSREKLLTLQKSIEEFKILEGCSNEESLCIGKDYSIISKYANSYGDAFHKIWTWQKKDDPMKAIANLMKKTSESINQPEDPVHFIGEELNFLQSLNLSIANTMVNENAARFGMEKEELKGFLQKISLRINAIEKSEQYKNWGEIVEADVKIFGGDQFKKVGKKIFYNEKQTFKNLKNYFGQEVLDHVIKRYAIETHRPISSDKLQALLIGIVANLTYEDLVYILKNESPVTQQIHRQDIIERAKKGTLTATDAAEAVLALRKNQMFHKPLEPFNKSSEYLESDQFENDWSFLEACLQADLYAEEDNRPSMKDVKEFSYAEYLARDIVYGLYANNRSKEYKNGTSANVRPGVLVPIIRYPKSKMNLKEEATGEVSLGSASIGASVDKTVFQKEFECKEAHHLISKNGLHATVLLPTSTHESNNKDYTVQILFRGTYDVESVKRDLHPGENKEKYKEGPGRLSFEENQAMIMEELQKIVAKGNRDNKPVQFQLFGHSLGATDSQRLCPLLTDLKMNISGIELYGFNPPGIEDPLDKNFSKNCIEKKIPFHAHYFKTGNDPVPLAGQALLGKHHVTESKEKNDDFTIKVFKFDSKIKGQVDAKDAYRIVQFLNSYYKAHTIHTMTPRFDLKSEMANDSVLQYFLSESNDKEKILKSLTPSKQRGALKYVY